MCFSPLDGLILFIISVCQLFQFSHFAESCSVYPVVGTLLFFLFVCLVF